VRQTAHRNFWQQRSARAWNHALRNITHAHFFAAKSCDELLEWSVGTVVAIIRKCRIDRDIQLPEKYKENFHVSSEGPSSGS
jgi:uncharacterized protein YfaQ (DUF2300 family)